MAIPKDRLYSTLAAALTTAAILATVPVLEMGINDDWSYTWVARELANTGHLVYNGWIGAMIGVQAAWAALLIRCFGFSFTLVRLSTLPFAAACAFLLYRLGRSAGLNASFALFGSLSVTLSPVFTPVAASFMTDVPGLFFWLACIYAGVRAVEAATILRACGWMAAAGAAGVAGGTVRQVDWFVPLLVLPAVAWLRRRERPIVIAAVLIWFSTALGIAVCVFWFLSQPHVTPLPHVSEPGLDVLLDVLETFLQIIEGCFLLMLPVLLLSLSGARQWIRKPLAITSGLLVAGALLGGLWGFDDDLLLGNMITPVGMLNQGTGMLGARPEILTPAIRFLLGAVLFIAVAAAVVCGVWLASGRSPSRSERPIRRFVILAGPTSLVYILTLVYHSIRDWILFDRYFIPLLPFFVTLLLLPYQRRFRETPPAWGWAAVAFFALFGIASTHDNFAAARARLQAATAVTSAGIPRRIVSAGLEYDGWTQLEQTGLIPTPAEQADAPPRRYPISPPYWFWARTPSVDPQYLVTYSRLPGLVDSPFPPIPYTAWLPPFHRRIFTLVGRPSSLHPSSHLFPPTLPD